MQQEIRPTSKQDLNGLKEVLDSSELFPSEYLDDMIADYFDNPNSEDIWFTAIMDGDVVGLGYCAPEKFTEGTYNLYAIGLRKEYQGKGIGKRMMHYIEDRLQQAGHRILIVETSGTPQFELTRKFYLQCNYNKEAVIRDFWSEGDDKVIFWKRTRKAVRKKLRRRVLQGF